MKTPLLICALLCGLAMFTLSSGCTTTTTVSPTGTTNTLVTVAGVTVTPAQIAGLLQTGVYAGLTQAVKQDGTNAVAYITLAVDALNSVIGGTNYSPAALTAAVNAMPVDATLSPVARQAITAAIQLYETFGAPYFTDQLNGNATALLFLEAFRDGAVQALATKP